MDSQDELRSERPNCLTGGPTPPRSPPQCHAAQATNEPRLWSGLRIVASSTLLSRILGMIRDMATARLFGLSPVMDAFAFAFRVPNLARRLFGEGALSAAFLPVFAREVETDGTFQSAWQLASAVFTLLTVVLFGLVLVGELILGGLAYVFAGDAETQLLLGLTAVMLPYAVLICLAAQLTAVLHALGHFRWPALVPVVLNLCLLATIWFVDPLFEPDRAAQAYALAVCVLVAGVLQLALQWPALRGLGYRFDAHWEAVRPAVKEIVASMLPVTLGLSITQINTLFDSLIAWLFSHPPGGGDLVPLLNVPYPLTSGAVSALYFGERLYQFPVGVFGVALGTVLFPRLARHAARGDMALLRDDLSLGMRLVLVIGIPASVGLALVAEPLTQVLFMRGEFSAEDAERTAGMIVAYGIGIWAYCGLPVLYRAMYAVGDQKAPLRTGLVAVVSDIVFNLILIWPFAERGLALTTAITAAIHVTCLTWFLQRRLGHFDWRGLAGTAGRVIVATGVMAAACLTAQQLIPRGETFGGQCLYLLGPMLAAMGAYFVAAKVLRLRELDLLVRGERSNEGSR